MMVREKRYYLLCTTFCFSVASFATFKRIRIFSYRYGFTIVYRIEAFVYKSGHLYNPDSRMLENIQRLRPDTAYQ